MAGRWSVFNFGKQPNNLKKQEVPNRKIDASDRIIRWEVDGAGPKNRNNFPQQLVQNVYNSPAGGAALDIWQEFVEGDGFTDPLLNSLRVNKTETLSDIHGKIASDISLLWGFAVCIGYDAEGRKKEIHHVPFEETRLGIIQEDGEVKEIAHNPYFGIPQDKYAVDTKYYYPYNPDPVHVKEEMKRHVRLRQKNKVKYDYPGQIYWFSIERPLARVYPQPFYYAGINWFIIDYKIQQFHERNLDNNFLLSVLMNMFGDPDAPAGPESKDDDGNRKDQGETVGEVFNKHLRDSLAGAQNGGSVMVNWAQSEEEKADIQPFPTNSHHELFLTLQNITTDQISIATKVPPILMSIRQAGKLGDTQELLNSIRVMQGRTRRMRNILAAKYKILFQDFPNTKDISDYTIKNVNPFNVMPQWAINELTTQERRKYINEHFPIEIDEDLVVSRPGEAQPVTAADTNEHLKNLTGKQFQAIQRIVRKYNKGEITYEQASLMLKSGYGLDDEQVDIWLVSQDEEEKEEELTEQ